MKITNEFILFLKNNNVTATIIATVMSSYVNELTTSFADNIILPIVYRDADGDGKADIKKLKDYNIVFSGINFRVGNFLTCLIKVFTVIVVLFLLNKYFFKDDPIKDSLV